MSEKIILASQSPFRKAQMEQLGLVFECQSPDLDERGIESNWDGALTDLPAHLSKKKAEAIAAGHPDAVVIGSDQMLIFQGQSYPKPSSLDECKIRLQALQGQTHELHTGICLMRQNQIETSTTIAKLTMHSLTDAQIEKYVSLDQPVGCAGAYKIEQKGLHLFKEIQTNDHSSIIGLPLLSLVSILRRWGISIL